MKEMNQQFDLLRQKLTHRCSVPGRKLPKIKVLRYTIEYIRDLQEIIALSDQLPADNEKEMTYEIWAQVKGYVWAKQKIQQQQHRQPLSARPSIYPGPSSKSPKMRIIDGGKKAMDDSTVFWQPEVVCWLEEELLSRLQCSFNDSGNSSWFADIQDCAREILVTLWRDNFKPSDETKNVGAWDKLNTVNQIRNVFPHSEVATVLSLVDDLCSKLEQMGFDRPVVGTSLIDLTVREANEDGSDSVISSDEDRYYSEFPSLHGSHAGRNHISSESLPSIEDIDSDQGSQTCWAARAGKAETNVELKPTVVVGGDTNLLNGSSDTIVAPVSCTESPVSTPKQQEELDSTEMKQDTICKTTKESGEESKSVEVPLPEKEKSPFLVLKKTTPHFCSPRFARGWRPWACPPQARHGFRPFFRFMQKQKDSSNSGASTERQKTSSDPGVRAAVFSPISTGLSGHSWPTTSKPLPYRSSKGKQVVGSAESDVQMPGFVVPRLDKKGKPLVFIRNGINWAALHKLKVGRIGPQSLDAEAPFYFDASPTVPPAAVPCQFFSDPIEYKDYSSAPDTIENSPNFTTLPANQSMSWDERLTTTRLNSGLNVDAVSFSVGTDPSTGSSPLTQFQPTDNFLTEPYMFEWSPGGFLEGVNPKDNSQTPEELPGLSINCDLDVHSLVTELSRKRSEETRASPRSYTILEGTVNCPTVETNSEQKTKALSTDVRTSEGDWSAMLQSLLSSSSEDVPANPSLGYHAWSGGNLVVGTNLTSVFSSGSLTGPVLPEKIEDKIKPVPRRLSEESSRSSLVHQTVPASEDNLLYSPKTHFAPIVDHATPPAVEIDQLVSMNVVDDKSNIPDGYQAYFEDELEMKTFDFVPKFRVDLDRNKSMQTEVKPPHKMRKSLPPTNRFSRPVSGPPVCPPEPKIKEPVLSKTNHVEPSSLWPSEKAKLPEGIDDILNAVGCGQVLSHETSVHDSSFVRRLSQEDFQRNTYENDALKDSSKTDDIFGTDIASLWGKSTEGAKSSLQPLTSNEVIQPVAGHQDAVWGNFLPQTSSPAKSHHQSCPDYFSAILEKGLLTPQMSGVFESAPCSATTENVFSLHQPQTVFSSPEKKEPPGLKITSVIPKSLLLTNGQSDSRADKEKRSTGQPKPCSFYLENGMCRKDDCRFGHDLTQITCRFWEEGGCFKGVLCPFLHGYPSEEPSSANASDIELTPDRTHNVNRRIDNANSTGLRHRYSESQLEPANIFDSPTGSMNKNTNFSNNNSPEHRTEFRRYNSSRAWHSHHHHHQQPVWSRKNHGNGEYHRQNSVGPRPFLSHRRRIYSDSRAF